MTTADADPARPAGNPSLALPPADAAFDGLPRRSTRGPTADHANPRGCPFLVADLGGWRLDVPSREHRCGAFSPAAPLAPEKQARLCLTPNHTTCATYLASLGARTERIGAAPVRRTTRWGLARTTSVVEDPGGLRGRFLAAVLDRRRWPAVPAVILVTILFVLALSGFRSGVPATAVATADAVTPTVAVDAGATTATQPSRPPAPRATEPEASPAQASPITTPAPSALGAPTSSPLPSFRTYTVRSGDTLGEVAGRFDTTVSEIARLNGISDPTRLGIGQVLRIP